MAVPINILQQVQTYNMAGLAFLSNHNCFIANANKKFQNFQNITGQLGDTVKFEKPPRFIAANGLVVTFQQSEQRYETLTVDKARNTSYAFTAQEFIFNVEEYMNRFGLGAIKELGAHLEIDMAKVAVENTYRFYGDGVTAINSYGQLGDALAYFRNYGAAQGETKGFIDDLAVPSIVNSGLSQFVMKRNEEIADSWRLGTFSNCEWYQSNVLPVHIAGTVGQNADTLTVVSTNDPTGANITQITCSGVSVNTGAIKLNDKLQFQDAVPGKPNLRYLVFVGHTPSKNPVQIRATADADATAGTVTFNIFPALVAVSGPNQNIEHNIVAGMQLKALPSHRAGAIYSGDSMYLAIPRLPDERPFDTATETDEETGVSLRTYYGSKFGENQRGMVHDVIWGRKLVDEYAMSLIFPL